MPVPVELALSTLLPTISFLPADLISLATSLLAQSRAKASSLKADEEIARTYACAHIACQRLANRLNLELARPTPPVKPRVYDKLFKYLDGVLQTPTTPRTNRKLDAVTSTPQTQPQSDVSRKIVSRVTPEHVSTPTTAGRKRNHDESETTAIPAFVMPMIREVCRSCDLPAAAPHVLVGITAASREIVERAQKRSAPVADADGPSASKRRRRGTPQSATATPTSNIPSTPTVEGLALSRYPALAVALYLCVAAKMRGSEVNDAAMADTRSRAVQAVANYGTKNKRTIPAELQGKMEGMESSVGFYLLEAEDCGWLDMEWYQNVPNQSEDEIAESVIEDEDVNNSTPATKASKTPLRRKEKHGQALAPAAGLLLGLGTMFQPAVDWLSDDRRAGYALWQRDMLKKIQ